MGNCTPKASLNYQGNYQEKFNKNGTLNYETHGTNVAENGSCCNKDNTLRNYPSNRKGRVEQKQEIKTFDFIDRLPVNIPPVEMFEERMEIGMLETHNVQTISVLPQHQNIRRTVM